MVKIINENFPRYNPVSYYKTYPTMVADNTAFQQKQVIEDKTKSKTNNLLFPMSLIAVGGLLLFLGLKKQSPEKVYENFVKGRMFEMDKKARSFTTYTKDTMTSVATEATTYINKFKKSRFINPTDNLGPLKSLRNPSKLIEAQDIAFDTIVSSANSHYKAGATDFDNFAVTMHKLSKDANDKVEMRQEITRLEIGDYVHVPSIKNEKFADLVEFSENKLISMNNFLSSQLDIVKREQFLSTSKRLYRQMAEAILESKKRVKQAKMNVIDTSFERMAYLLDLKYFKPSYSRVPEAVDFPKLTPEQLKPMQLPKKLKKEMKSNLYIDLLMKKDFANLTDKDIGNIFNSIHSNNNLQDLGFLIDRLRLRQVLYKSKNPNTISVYDVMIPKLEYLSKQLHEYGNRELLKFANKDFDKMGLQKKQVEVYYLMSIAKRIGYEDITEFDAGMMKNSSRYKDMNIKKYISIFSNNPDLYFS